MLWRTLVLSATLLGAGCFGTPQPNPPNVRLDEGKVEGFGTRGEEVYITGCPGAVAPPHATVRIFSLDRSDPPEDALSDAAGGFSAEVPGSLGEEFRFQLWFDGHRSAAGPAGHR